VEVRIMQTPMLPLPVDDLIWRRHLEGELKRCVDLLVAHYAPEKIFLFGSLAVGQAHLWSDAVSPPVTLMG
jgi:hypothetical protein